jgi:ABC-type lipoprotein export system ATPase subunit
MNKIASLHIEEFTVFKKNTIEFSPGLNVLIGKNGTGKTHLLKIIYSLLKSHPKWQNLILNFRGTFKIDSSSELIRKPTKETHYDSRVLLDFLNEDKLGFIINKLNETGTGIQGEMSNRTPIIPEGLYIPPQEMLSIFDGFIASWEKRENSFDQTYYDLAKALSLSPLKDTELLDDLIAPLEKILSAKVVRENGRFYLEYEWGKVEAHLVAEGLRKLSQIIYLIGNGSINENTVLLWDKPEVHFNPSLIEAIVVLLKNLVDKGLQIFITTHDYLLSQRLSLISEYENHEFPIKFFCLENEGDKGIKIEEGTTLAEIKENPILNEFAEYYDFERAAFNKSSKV